MTHEPSAAGGPPSLLIRDHRACITCGYDLHGLGVLGTCPECATSVEQSLRGILLQFASPEYLGEVRSGLTWVLNGILVKVLLMVVGMFMGMMWAAGGGGGMGIGNAYMLVMAGVTLGTTLAIAYGYYRLTVPDPQFLGAEKPDSARSVVRIAVLVQVGLSLVETAAAFLTGALGGATGVVMMAASWLGVAVWVVQFFAMMRYTRWLAQRVPDAYIVKRTGVYIWLLPVLFTVGIVLLGLGPVIALVMYWNLLHRLRQHLVSIRKSGEPAKLTNMLA